MDDWNYLGKTLVYTGLAFVFLGLIIWGGSRVFTIGKLPGDIFFQRKGFTIYFPIATSLLLSLLLTLLLNIIRR